MVQEAMKMRKALLLFVLIFGIGVSVYLIYQGRNVSGINTALQTGEVTPTVVAVLLKPPLANWDIGDRLVVSEGEVTLATHIVVLTGQQTIVIFSRSGVRFSDPLPSTSVQMNDDANRTYSLVQSVPLAQLERLQFSAMTFEPRQLGARQLRMQVRVPSAAQTLDASIAQLHGSAEDSYHTGLLAGLYREGYLEQAGYRISHNGWGMAKGDAVARGLSATGIPMTEVRRVSATQAAMLQPYPGPGPVATPTIIPMNPLASSLSGGKPIRLEATLRIENLQSKQVNYLYIVILMDGDVKATLLQ